MYKLTTSRRPRNSLRKESVSTGGGPRGESVGDSFDDQSVSPSPPSHTSTSHKRTQSIQPIASPAPVPNSNLFYDTFESHNVQVPTTFLHPGTLPVRPTGPVRSVTGPASTSAEPFRHEIFGSSLRQGQKDTRQALDIPTQLSTRLPPMKDPQPAHPPTPPLLNVPSPTPSVHSTKVETSTPLPPRSILLKLVEIYFTHVNNQTYGFLHRPTFLRHIEEGKVPEGLLYSICAISARFSTTHAPPPLPRHSTKEAPAYHAGEPYAIEARRLALRDFDKPTVQNVQTLLLLALHDFGGKKGQKAWMFAGMAIRMASALRLSREVDGDPVGAENASAENVSQQAFGLPEPPRPKEKVSWTEREVRRRTFWACFIMDVVFLI